MLNIALFGPPGAGKGTQSKLLVEKYNLTYIATGDILREEIAAGTELGEKAKEIINKGGLASDEIIVQIIERKIKTDNQKNGFLFDGFPRTVVQAYILEGLLLKLNTSISCVLSLDAPEEELKNRLLSRSKIEGRSDDNIEVIENRLKEYNQKTAPVAKFYEEQGILYPVNGIGSVEEIFDNLVNSVESLLKNAWFNIILAGRPGSGKGTQSKKLSEKFNFVHIATGDMLRKEIEDNSEIGKNIKSFVELGNLVPDEIVVKLIEKKINLNQNTNGFLFDGFPVNLVQSYILDGLLRKLGSSINSMIYLDVATIQCIRRLQSRWETPERRSYDESVDVIVNRLEKYEKKIMKLNDYYHNYNKFRSVDGLGETDVIFKRLCEVIEHQQKNPV